MVKKRLRDPARMQLRAMAMARCVSAGAGSTDQDDIKRRCWAMNPPPARSVHKGSLIGVSLKVKSSTSLASGSLATVSWYS